ncbi:oligopeptide transport system substrate-binding protein [Paenibacillus sp. UNCCL117]|uniref:peptide ABC transporter substrate-binding protein n=1 Tax=unclassified Paenibacillus TaxID=185978 RepID=UPI00088FFB10|nr:MULTISPECIES: peptide ABC transporter substrate-binding protein [unclassified Paenibacillus]SDC73597.1 oligopeptide transport system substrate-binding protein [Paenibacillus sp. cl123]SFW25044.1 oligopeptide transport system substrate-binding protein [Paenibacillus sp. UNCCL117]
MKLNKLLVLASVTAMLGATVAGCSGNANQEQIGGGATDNKKAPAQEIRINMSAEPPALDSSIATTNPSFTILNAVNEGLYRLDAEGKPQPGLAKELPKISPDGLVYTITLRDGLKWADGSALTANDFVWAYQRTLDPATKAKYASMLAWIKGGADLNKAKPEELEAKKAALGIKAKDDKTLEITLERPVAFFVDQLANPLFFPQKADFVTKQGDKNGADADKVMGAGPFKLEKWDHEQQLVMVKNENYWDAANVKLNKVTVNVVKDPNTALNMFETNQVDLTELRGEQSKMFQGKPELAIKKEFVTAYVMFHNSKNPAFANAKVRQALGMAIDRKAYNEVVLGGTSIPSTGLVPGTVLDGNKQEFRKTAGDTQTAFDAAKAKALLAEGLKELNMTALPKFKLTSDDTETSKKTIEFIQAQWKQNLGVDVDGEPLPFALRVKNMQENNFDALIALWGADYNDPMTFLDMWVSDNKSFNYVQYNSKAYDDLVKGADKEVDVAKRAQMLVEAEKVLMNDAPIYPLYFRTKPYAKNANVDGLILPAMSKEWELRWVSIK